MDHNHSCNDREAFVSPKHKLHRRPSSPWSSFVVWQRSAVERVPKSPGPWCSQGPGSPEHQPRPARWP